MSRDSFLDSPSYRKIIPDTQRRKIEKRRRSDGLTGTGSRSNPIRRTRRGSRADRRVQTFDNVDQETLNLSIGLGREVRGGTNQKIFDKVVAQRKKTLAGIKQRYGDLGVKLSQQDVKNIVLGDQVTSSTQQQFKQKKQGRQQRKAQTARGFNVGFRSQQDLLKLRNKENIARNKQASAQQILSEQLPVARTSTRIYKPTEREQLVSGFSQDLQQDLRTRERRQAESAERFERASRNIQLNYLKDTGGFSKGVGHAGATLAPQSIGEAVTSGAEKIGLVGRTIAESPRRGFELLGRDVKTGATSFVKSLDPRTVEGRTNIAVTGLTLGLSAGSLARRASIRRQNQRIARRNEIPDTDLLQQAQKRDLARQTLEDFDTRQNFAFRTTEGTKQTTFTPRPTDSPSQVGFNPVTGIRQDIDLTPVPQSIIERQRRSSSARSNPPRVEQRFGDLDLDVELPSTPQRQPTTPDTISRGELRTRLGGLEQADRLENFISPRLRNRPAQTFDPQQTGLSRFGFNDRRGQQAISTRQQPFSITGRLINAPSKLFDDGSTSFTRRSVSRTPLIPQRRVSPAFAFSTGAFTGAFSSSSVGSALGTGLSSTPSFLPSTSVESATLQGQTPSQKQSPASATTSGSNLLSAGSSAPSVKLPKIIGGLGGGSKPRNFLKRRRKPKPFDFGGGSSGRRSSGSKRSVNVDNLYSPSIKGIELGIKQKNKKTKGFKGLRIRGV